MNGWWRTQPDDAYDWAFSIDLIQHYFPSLKPIEMTLENFWGKLKVIKKLLGVDETKPLEGMAPDDFFTQALNGTINPEDFGIEVPKLDDKAQTRLKQEQELRRLGLI